MAKKVVALEEMKGEVYELPVGYTDDNGTLHKEVELVEMTGAVEEEVAKPEVRSNVGKIVTTLLAHCVIRVGTIEKRSVSPSKWEKIMRDLFLGDRDFILLKLREITYGTEMSFDTKCPNCKKGVKIEFTLDELEMAPVKGDPSRIPFELPKGYRDKEGNVTKAGFMRMPTGFDQEQLDALAKKNPGMANTTLITRCVFELGEVKLSSKVFRDLSQKDREYLVNELADNVFGPKFVVTAFCDNCGDEFEAGVNPVNFI